MATIRIAGFGTVFELEDSKVGIGTDAATNTLQALGNIRSEAATDAGISSLTTYQGFVDKEARFSTGQIDIDSQSGATSSEIVIDGDVTVSSATTFTSGPQNLTVTDTFSVPTGNTDSRIHCRTAGSLRFNQDFATLEFFTGNNWATVNTFTDIQNSPGNRGRAVFAGGNETDVDGNQDDHTKTSDFVQISTLGNALDFGELDQSTAQCSAYGSSIKIWINGFGQGNSVNNYMQYASISSGGNFEDWGNLTESRRQSCSFNSSTRGITAGGGNPGSSNVMDYIELSTLGDALDFGDLHTGRRTSNSACSSPIRGFIADGNVSIGVVTIASKGNEFKTGDLTFSGAYKAGASNQVKGIFAGGGPGFKKTIESYDLSTGGNAIVFGDLSFGRKISVGAANGVRYIAAGGGEAPDPAERLNNIEFVTISNGGSSQDFGDLTSKRASFAGHSDSHGGLGGF